MGFLTKCPISAVDMLGVLSTETGHSVLQAFNTSTSLEFMAQLVCKSQRGGCWGVLLGEKGKGVALQSMSEQEMTTRWEGKRGGRHLPSAQTAALNRDTDVQQRENDSLLDVCLEVSVVDGRPTQRGKTLGEPLNCRVNGSDLQCLCLSNVCVCKSSTRYKLPLLFQPSYSQFKCRYKHIRQDGDMCNGTP